MNPSLFGEDKDFRRAFQQLTSEPPESASARFELPDEELEQIRKMCREMADDGESWERVALRCVRRAYVGEG